MWNVDFAVTDTMKKTDMLWHSWLDFQIWKVMKRLVEASLLIFALYDAQWFVLCPVIRVRFVCVVCSHINASHAKSVFPKSWPRVVLCQKYEMGNSHLALNTSTLHFLCTIYPLFFYGLSYVYFNVLKGLACFWENMTAHILHLMRMINVKLWMYGQDKPSPKHYQQFCKLQNM